MTSLGWSGLNTTTAVTTESLELMDHFSDTYQNHPLRKQAEHAQDSWGYKDLEGAEGHSWFKPGDLVSHVKSDATGEVVPGGEPGMHRVHWDPMPGHQTGYTTDHGPHELKMDAPATRKYQWDDYSRHQGEDEVPHRLVGKQAGYGDSYGRGTGNGYGHYDGAGLSPFPPLDYHLQEQEDPLESFWTAYAQSIGEEGMDLNAWMQFVYSHNVPLSDYEAVQWFDDHARKSA